MTARARAQDKPGVVLIAQAAKTRMEAKAMTDHHQVWVDVPDDTVRSAAVQADVAPVHTEVAGVDTNATPAINWAHHVEVADINVESEGDVRLERRDTFQVSSQAVLNVFEVSCCCSISRALAPTDAPEPCPTESPIHGVRCAD
jgi:hypothetical protein